MVIHKEGRKLLFNLFVILVIVNLLVSYFLPEQEALQNILLVAGVIFYLCILQFFRSPRIKSPEIDPKCIIAPADGKVVVIENTVENEYFKDNRKQVSIFMSPVNVHVNRNPVSGIVKYFKYHAGDYLVAWHPKSSTDNERTTTVVESEDGVEVMFRQIAGALARRIKWYIDIGDPVRQGEEFGFIKFGSRVDIFLPLDAEVKVEIGEKTKGGKTVIAELP
ncbi:phosphatidylserine decarboxylase family protein [Xanthovirga aplysinae]|uniref:phosphatidylserine decarboxylase family protein n=1 Tax=Xanthovirga aplysinae TaxID=2529853 RepID=UPI0012BCDBFB|nr:phosphatidylserine decarboxylase family protein [Xanthovirga aplysinae]MTI30804.1 phosphatidylserine decarboxylase family protein [Xanthovirga aplysinae]